MVHRPKGGRDEKNVLWKQVDFSSGSRWVEGFSGADFFGDYPDEPWDPHVIRIHKGAAGEMDQFKTQGLQINYTESDRPMTVLKDFYHDVKDLDPIMIGDAVWQGILAVNANVPRLCCG